MHSSVKLWGCVVFQAVCQRKGDRRDGSETDRTLLWSGAIQRAEGLQVKHAWAGVFNNIIKQLIINLFVFNYKKRKADQHHTWLGGCSSWRRSEQSRWCKQVRLFQRPSLYRSNTQFFTFSVLISSNSTGSDLFCERKNVIWGIELICLSSLLL